MMPKQNLKVNLHVCEHCNYHCMHCFAKFGCTKMLNVETWSKIVENVMKSGRVAEINIAGGEPLLHPQMMEIVDVVRSYGVPVSLVTNGSLMTNDWIQQNGHKFKTIGFSIDALTPELQRTVGRCTASGGVISPEEFGEKIVLLREVNPEIRIKVNTVISKVNLLDNLAEYVKSWQIDRWKLLKMQIFDDGVHCNAGIAVSDQEYDRYAENVLASFGMAFDSEQVLYQAGKMEIVAERFLKGGYLMIGANGFLLDDTKNESYTRVCDCRSESFAEGLKKLTFYEELYTSRYEKDLTF